MEEPPAPRRKPWQDLPNRIYKRIRSAVPFASGVLAALVGILLYHIAFPGQPLLTTNDVNQTVANAMASATPPPPFSELVYQVIQPSLVLIETQSTDAQGQLGGALGSGVVVDDQGDILTALHVVKDAREIKVTFADGTEANAQIATQQPENDIAVLSPDQLPEILVPATLGSPRNMAVGDEVYTVGNPFGLYSSMSAGVISGFNRSFQPENSNQKLQGLIQIDAAVNPGNSGGPLVNRAGQVIGIVEGLANPTDQNFFIGIGFAVPINVATSGFGSLPY